MYDNTVEGYTKQCVQYSKVQTSTNYCSVTVDSLSLNLLKPLLS